MNIIGQACELALGGELADRWSVGAGANKKRAQENKMGCSIAGRHRDS